MTDSNVLIAKFMGFSPREDGTWHIYYEDWDDFFEPEEMEYHHRWSWLMTVVEKIESINTGVDEDSFYNVVIDYPECRIEINYPPPTSNWNLCDGICEVGENKKHSVFKAVVKFIKWYNENNNN